MLTSSEPGCKTQARAGTRSSRFSADPLEIKKFVGQDEAGGCLLIRGDSRAILNLFPDECIDLAITSPPYWKKREYDDPNAIGGEPEYQDYIRALLEVFGELRRVLKPTGSFWLNLGDTYNEKSLCGIPWRVALALQDEQGWLLRNDVIWNKVKGGLDNAPDKLKNMHEYMFHFVKTKRYFYDLDAIRNRPKIATVKNGAVVTATGVSGINYRRQIPRSSNLSEEEKFEALKALEDRLRRVAQGELADFRMVIRGQQRTTHSDSTKVSGRAGELVKRGFYFLTYHKNGSKPGDVWDIIPEDTWRRDAHFAPFPEELCMIPVRATCPPGGTVLDPFVGTGTALVVAANLGRKGVGIDASSTYLEVAEQRLARLQPRLPL